MRSIFISFMLARFGFLCALSLCFCLPYALADKPMNIKKVLFLFPEEDQSATTGTDRAIDTVFISALEGELKKTRKECPEAMAFLQKPFDMENLLTLVHSISGANF